jgi:LysR family transcriptional regulator, benzoate and cis,cis-muconate-responsive activator of ben and cat genes
MDDRVVEVDLRGLRYFIAVAEELHFSRAAARLHLDQPTLSRHIRRLEDGLGVKLLERTTRSVSLTEAGEEFLGRARDVIASADVAVNAARDAAAARTAVLRVGMMAHAAEPLRSRAFNLFAERHPSVELKPRSYPFVDPACGLESGETDVALVWLPIEHPQIETERMFEEPRYFIVADDHPLAGRRSLRREDVEEERFFTWPDSWGLSPTTMTWGDFFQLQPKLDGTRRVMGPEVRDEEEWLDALVRGLAITTTPASFKTYYPWPGLTFIRARGLDPVVVAVAWRRDTDNPLVTSFIEIIRELRDTAGAKL